MIGCGYCVKTVRRRRYLYFWHYENRGGRREQVEEYVGPANDSGTRETVARKVAAYAERARTEMGKFVELTRSEMATRSCSASPRRYRYLTVTSRGDRRAPHPAALRV